MLLQTYITVTREDDYGVIYDGIRIHVLGSLEENGPEPTATILDAWDEERTDGTSYWVQSPDDLTDVERSFCYDALYEACGLDSVIPCATVC